MKHPPLTDLLLIPALALLALVLMLLLGSVRAGWYCCYGDDAGE